MERTKMPNLRNGNKGGFEPGRVATRAHLIASPAFYHALHSQGFYCIVDWIVYRAVSSMDD